MRYLSRGAAVVLLCALAVLSAGCGNPYVGTWKATEGGMTSTMVLEKEGKGKIDATIGPRQQNVPLTWTEKEGTITLQLDMSNTGLPPGFTLPALTGTLSQDKKTINIAMGQRSLPFQKQ